MKSASRRQLRPGTGAASSSANRTAADRPERRPRSKLPTSASAAATCISGRPTTRWPVNYPVVLGHEFGGHIVETRLRGEGLAGGRSRRQRNRRHHRSGQPDDAPRTLQPRSDPQGIRLRRRRRDDEIRARPRPHPPPCPRPAPVRTGLPDRAMLRRLQCGRRATRASSPGTASSSSARGRSASFAPRWRSSAVPRSRSWGSSRTRQA